MINKKGDINFLVATVITILGFLVIGGVLMRSFSKGDEKQQEILCQSSVTARMATAVDVSGTEVRVLPPLCTTIDKEISGSKEEVQRQIAEKMARCKWMFGEGRYDEDLFRTITIFGGEGHCFQCYSMYVKEITEDGQDVAVTPNEFADFLRTKELLNEKTTYLDKLQAYDSYTAMALTPEGIAANRGYAIAFKPVRNECPECWITNLGASAGLLVGTGLMFIPLGVTQIAGGVILLGSAALGIDSSYNTVRDVFTSGPNLNTVYLIDMSHPEMNKVFGESCVRVDDIAGK